MTGDHPIWWCGCAVPTDGHRCDPDRLRGETSLTRPDLAHLSIGQRVAAFRKLRGLTQAGLAARLHRSASWVTKVERGERRLDSVEVLRDLSRALAVPVSQLTGRDDAGLAGERPERGAFLGALRQVVSRPAIVSARDGAPEPVADLERDLAGLRRRYNHSRRNLSAVSRDLPDLLGRAQATVHTAPPAEQARAYAVLSELYRLAALVLRRIGDQALGRVAIDRAMSAAEQSGDLLRIGTAGTFLGLHLMTQGEPADGLAFSLEIAQLLLRDSRIQTATGTVVAGALHNYAGMMAAHAGDQAESQRLLKVAHENAERLRQDREAYGMFFGPANAVTMEHAALLDLGHPTRAVRQGERVPAGDAVATLGSVCRASQHYVHLARAYSMSGRDDDALAILAIGVRVAPEMVGEHPLARELVRSALRRRRRAGEQLRRLAHEVGVLD